METCQGKHCTILPSWSFNFASTKSLTNYISRHLLFLVVLEKLSDIINTLLILSRFLSTAHAANHKWKAGTKFYTANILWTTYPNDSQDNQNESYWYQIRQQVNQPGLFIKVILAFPYGKSISGIDHRIAAALLSADVPYVALPLLGLIAATTRSTALEAYSPGTSKKIEVGATVVFVFNVEYTGRMTKIIWSGATADEYDHDWPGNQKLSCFHHLI